MKGKKKVETCILMFFYIHIQLLDTPHSHSYLSSSTIHSFSSFDLALFVSDQSNVTSCQHTTQLIERFIALEVKKPFQIVLTKSDLLVNLPTADVCRFFMSSEI